MTKLKVGLGGYTALSSKSTKDTGRDKNKTVDKARTMQRQDKNKW